MSKTTALLLLCVLLIGAGAYFAFSGGSVPFLGSSNTEEITGCTKEAMICPDGSAVGRTGPSCAFAPCPSSTEPSENSSDAILKATPATGPSPLTVVFTSTIGDTGDVRPSFVDGQDTMLDFGDGNPPQWMECAGSGQTCETPLSIRHTYSSAGTYTASIKKIGGNCRGGCPIKIIESVTIRAN